MRRPAAASSEEDTDRKVGDIARVDLDPGKAVVSFATS